MTSPEPGLTARERIAAHRLCGDADELASQAPWAAWVLRPLAKLIRWMDADLQNRRGEDDEY